MQRFLLLASAALKVLIASSQAEPIEFSGYRWIVKSGDRIGPGPNAWAANNVWVDQTGRLHLAVRHRNDHWYCAELSTLERLGFGRYDFWVLGSIGKLDPNVVFGLFSYPTSDVGPDGTHEIDIEFARWGDPQKPVVNYSVWPVQQGLQPAHEAIAVELDGTKSRHRFVRGSTYVRFQSLLGYDGNNRSEAARWSYEPSESRSLISQEPMSTHMSLWLFKGEPPSDGREAEVIIERFRFSPQ